MMAINISLFVAAALAVVYTVNGQDTICGVQEEKPHAPPSPYIVGGGEAIPHSWPWQVLLRYGQSKLTCGGSLIQAGDGRLVVLTAAHCVDTSIASLWKVDVGVHSIQGNEPNQQTFTASSFTMHPNYNTRTFANDIAIMRVSGTISTNRVVQPICVTSRETSLFFGQSCVVTGWGTTTEGGSISDKLQEVYKPVLNDTQCKSYLGNGYDNNTMLCAGFSIGGADACQGDSGGPFMCQLPDRRWDVIGVVSWGYGCARPERPGVYADVHKYVTWINNNA